MIGEIAIGGVFLPTLLLIGIAALVATGLVTRLLSLTGFYHLVLYRALVDLSFFVLIFASLSWFFLYRTAP